MPNLPQSFLLHGTVCNSRWLLTVMQAVSDVTVAIITSCWISYTKSSSLGLLIPPKYFHVVNHFLCLTDCRALFTEYFTINRPLYKNLPTVLMCMLIKRIVVLCCGCITDSSPAKNLQMCNITTRRLWIRVYYNNVGWHGC